MHTKEYSIENQLFLVNGIKCELSVDRECLIWTPASINGAINGDGQERLVKRLNLDQVIGFRRWTPQDEQLHQRHIIEVSETLDEKQLNESSKQQQQYKNGSPIKRNLFDCRKCDKIKVYYAKQNENKSSGQLLKLKKLIIEPVITVTTKPTKSSSNQPQHEQVVHVVCQDEKKLDKTVARPLENLAKQLEASLEPKRKQRPKRLLVFVNPFGGKGRASQVYKSEVHRLFDIAGVETQLVVTKYANHARDTIEDPLFNVELYDGIVCVGGDGMFSELMNGLLYRYNRDLVVVMPTTTTNSDTNSNNNDRSNDDNNHHHSKNDENENSNEGHRSHKIRDDEQQLVELRLALGGIGKPFVSPPIPVGVIGAGSTDANSFGLIGTNDVITATLNIILGNQIKIDVCSVHTIERDRLLRFVSTFVAYGYFGDVIRESEKFRWLGPSRYDLTGANNLIKNRTYKGLVRILISAKDGTPFDVNRCHANCELCCLSSQNNKGSLRSSIMMKSTTKSPGDLEPLSFIERQGHFIGVNAAITACRCPQTKKGFSPNNHLANGCADLILVRPCSRIQYIQYLMRTGWTKKSPFDLKYVEAFRCRQFEFVAQHQDNPNSTSSTTTTTTSTTSSSSSNSSASPSSSAVSIADHGSNYSSLDSKQSEHSSEGSLGDTLSSWNVDGEILNEQSIRVKVNNQLLRVFGTGEPLF